MKHFVAIALATCVSTAALADGHATGDAAAGEDGFKKCKSCHMIVSDAGETIVKGGKTGPNLWGIVGRVAGSDEAHGKKYSKSMIAAGEAGLVWDEEQFVAYMAGPTPYLREYLDDKKARGKMSFKLSKGAEDIWAYLASVSPVPEMAEEEEAVTTN